MEIIVPNKPLFGKGKNSINKGAFRGELECPMCNTNGLKKSRWRFVEKIGPTRIRYQCKDCGSFIQYDFSNNVDFLAQHPYSPYKKRRFADIVSRYKHKPIR